MYGMHWANKDFIDVFRSAVHLDSFRASKLSFNKGQIPFDVFESVRFTFQKLILASLFLSMRSAHLEVAQSALIPLPGPTHYAYYWQDKHVQATQNL
jgi:hypothetical protein